MKRFLWTVLMTAVLMVAVFRFTGWYADATGPWLDRLGNSVGEVLLDEGLRLQAAGQVEEARSHYEKALEVRFEGDQNRRYTHLLLARIALEEEHPAAARRHLEAAIATGSLARRDPAFLEEANERLNRLPE
jgi:tetratricopeptide (TPR) repeat protein